MGNLLGENFPDFVREQVKTRQEVYGKTSRTTQDLEYLNNKSAWIKLGSAVDIDPESKKYKDLGIPDGYGGNELAKSLVLFNGSSSGGRNNFKGIARDGSIINTSTYGFGGLDFGLVPMPGIKSVSTKYKNRGSLREATINLVAYNKKQFEIIELLYLRLGYTLLLEYGYDKYLNKDQELVDQGSSLMGKFLNRKYTTFYEVLDDIKETRANKDGNYDGFVGKVKNFNWTFNKDGSYDITIVLISMGDIIESLNINTIKDYTSDSIEDLDEDEKKEQNKALSEAETTEELIDLLKDTNEFASIFFNIKQNLKKSDSGVLIQNKGVSYGFSKDTQVVTYKKHVFDDGSNDDFYYVRFSRFLELLENNIIFQVKNGNNKQPSLKFDYEIPTNFMNTNPTLVSVDPRICLIDNSFDLTNSYMILFGISNAGSSIETRYFGDGHLPYDQFPEKQFRYSTSKKNSVLNYGRIMNIFLELGFILNKIEENKDDKGKVSLFGFLESICQGVNESLGNVCDLSPILDEETNTLKIIDNNPLPNKETLINQFGDPTLPTTFEVYGYNPNTKEAGFVKEFGFKTEISNALATTITIGAQANGNVKGEDSTAFTAWNEGLTDSLALEKVDPTPPPPSPEEIEEQANKKSNLKEKLKQSQKDLEKTSNKYDEILENYGSSTPFQIKSGKFKEKQVEKLKDLQRNLKNLEDQISNLQNELSSLESDQKPLKSSTSQIGFIPLNLSLTMDGLTGFKIYQKFFVSQRVLPPNYPDNLEFLIKGITHKVDSSGWETTLETQSIPKNVTSLKEGRGKDSSKKDTLPSDSGFVDDEITETDIIESPLKTSYPELPFVSPPPPQTLLPYQEAVQILSEITDISTARAVFAIMFAEASKNPERTAFKSAGGFNYSGTQTDAGRWGNSEYITGRFARRDAVRVREFAIFENNRGFLEFMALRVKAKEIPGINADAWTRKYIDKWWSPANKAQLVQGTPKYENKKNIFLSADRRFDRFLA